MNAQHEIPFEYVIWDAQECADYLRESYSHFIKRTQFRPGFPDRCKGPGQPRWQAKAVADWKIGRQAAA